MSTACSGEEKEVKGRGTGNADSYVITSFRPEMKVVKVRYV